MSAQKKDRLTKRDLQRIETRNRVFEAALDEFKRVGVDNTQIENIVKKAEVSIGTYYRYFPTKDAVLFEQLQRYIVELAGIIETSMQQQDITLEELLLGTIEPLFDFYEKEDETLMREIFGVIVKQPPKDFDWLSVPLLTPIIEAFQTAYENGESVYQDPVRPTRLYFTSFLGFLTSMNPIRHRQEAREFTRLFIRGIRPS